MNPVALSSVGMMPLTDGPLVEPSPLHAGRQRSVRTVRPTLRGAGHGTSIVTRYRQ